MKYYKYIDDESLKACSPANGSGEITVDEFQHCVYKLELGMADLSNKEELLRKHIGVNAPEGPRRRNWCHLQKNRC